MNHDQNVGQLRDPAGKFSGRIRSDDVPSLPGACGDRAGTFTVGKHVTWANRSGDIFSGMVIGTPTAEGIPCSEDGEDTHWVDEDDLEIDPDPTLLALIESIKASGDTYELTFVSRDDKLYPREMAAYLAGDVNAVEEHVDETFTDSRFVGLEHEIGEALSAADLERSEISEDVMEHLREVISDNDTSDLIPQLVRNSGSQLMRVPLAIPELDISYANTEGATEVRVAKITELLAEQGLDTKTEEAQEAIRELVDNGPSTWHESVKLEVIYYGDPSEATIFDQSNGEKRDKTFSFQNPNILLIDSFNGSGHDVQISGIMTATATANAPVVLDEDPDGGYGWDRIAGVVKSAYRAEPEVSWA